jgi:hypothetical protein
MTSQQLIERLQAIQAGLGHAVDVAIQSGNNLPDLQTVTTAGAGQDTIIVLSDY